MLNNILLSGWLLLGFGDYESSLYNHPCAGFCLKRSIVFSLSLFFFFGWRTLTDMNTLEYIKWNRQLPTNTKAQSQYTWYAQRSICNLDWNKLYSNMLDTDFFFYGITVHYLSSKFCCNNISNFLLQISYLFIMSKLPLKYGTQTKLLFTGWYTWVICSLFRSRFFFKWNPDTCSLYNSVHHKHLIKKSIISENILQKWRHNTDIFRQTNNKKNKILPRIQYIKEIRGFVTKYLNLLCTLDVIEEP